MNKPKARFYLFFIVLLTIAACSPPPAESVPTEQAPKAAAESPPTESEPAEASTSLDSTVITWFVQTDEIEQAWEQEFIIPAFEAIHPEISINLVVVPWNEFEVEFAALAAAGAPPDIWSHSGTDNFADYLNRGQVADLTPYIERDAYDLSDFIPEALQAYNIDGKLYGLPIQTTASFVFYNRDLFDAAGVAYPPTSWDDTTWTYAAFLEKCDALTAHTDDSAQAVYGCLLDAWPNDQYALMFGQSIYPPEAYTTGFASKAYLDSEAAIAGFQARQDIVWKYGYMPDPAQLQPLISDAGLFESQKVAMQLTGGWGWTNFAGLEAQFNWGVAPIPYGSPDRKAITYTDPWMLSSRSAHPDEAWEFLKYLVSPEAQKAYLEIVNAPPARQSVAEIWYTQFPSMNPEQVKELHLGGLEYGQETPSHMLVEYDQLNRVVTISTTPIFMNMSKAADVLPEANANLEKALLQIQTEYGE
ncbi:MAG: sugar ABC transporter substrate-binding protein [Anaerolineales bacterium]|nr:sugar ABC transporter substrate-binding protein [Anaerolineales bacterium]